ncbi:glycosyltransferase family 4 protein [Bacillus dakarensis]|uniref:glycosyltransferase family 4 protein n=1 Tax=Robertmurraya dakarensis TaxID=1926278 RepID=UPI000981018C|nr:glycosyltransferase family 4 protein [Bacillus dakarensis]
MSGKILLCATVDYHFSAFHLPYMKWFKERGWEVHVAANGEKDLPYVDKKYHLPIQRSPFCRANIDAYRKLKGIIEENQYNLIHCHTPVGGVLARLAAREVRKTGTKVLYTAHGFHFCKGAPILNWMIYYPIEKKFAQFTDCLITINQEDYQTAFTHQFKAERIEHVHGVGVDTSHFQPASHHEKNELRKSYGYNSDDFLLFYGAEFNQNKNQQLLIRSVNEIKSKVPNVKLVLAGDGPLLADCKELTQKLSLEKIVHFLGYRTDMKSLLSISDVAVASSLREGLPVNIMEAMACGLPVVATDNRGHRELIKNDRNGWVITDQDEKEFSEKIKLLSRDPELRKSYGMSGRKLMESTYSLTKVLEEKSKLYSSYMKEQEGVMWAVH